MSKILTSPASLLHPIRAAATTSAPRPRAAVDEIGEGLALALVEHGVDVAQRLEDGRPRLAGRGVDAAEHGAERGVVERRSTQRRREVGAGVPDAAAEVAQPRLQAIDLADDRALL